MNRKRFVVIPVILLLMFFQASGQDAAVKVKLDTNAMLIGDQVVMHISFEGPAGVKLNWPMVGDTILGSLQVIARSKIDSSFSVDKKRIGLAQKFKLTTFDSGNYQLPSLRIYYKVPRDTTQRFAESQPVLLAVHSVVVDTTQAIKPIKGPMKVRISFRELLPWIIGVWIVFVVLALIGFFIWKRKKHQPLFQFRPKVELLPHEIAMMELEKLRARKLWQQGKIKDYYTELTDILRIYIEKRFLVPALESTSSEIMDSLKDIPDIQPEIRSKLSGILVIADLVKFAKELPVGTTNEQSLEWGFDFVNNTITVVKSEEDALAGN